MKLCQPKKTIIYFVILFVLIATVFFDENQQIFRHGDRTIRRTYNTDPYKDKAYWPEDFGQLTNVS